MNRQDTECDICRREIAPDEQHINDGGEVAHTSCVRDWFRRNFGREALS